MIRYLPLASILQNFIALTNGSCTTVGRVVAYDSRNLIIDIGNLVNVNCKEKTKIKKKEAVNGPIKIPRDEDWWTLGTT